MKYICAVGDSFVFGAELVTTYFPNEFKDLPPAKLTEIEFSISLIETQHQKRYYELLDSMRFSSLVARGIGASHINYAQGGASQEGIKMQTYLLLEHLKEKGIDPADTIWLVGLTMDCRRLMLDDPMTSFHSLISDTCKDEYWAWSRYTVRTFFNDRNMQMDCFTNNFTKETIAASTETSNKMHWIMNVLDTVNLLKAANVQQTIVLNLFTGDHPGFTRYTDCTATQKLCNQLSKGYTDIIAPSANYCFTELLRRESIGGKCKDGHPDVVSNKAIADYLIKQITQ